MMTFFTKMRQYASPVTYLKLLLTVLLLMTPNLLEGAPAHGILEVGELVALYIVVLAIGKHLRFLGWLVSSLLTFLIVAQEWVRLFSGTYTTKIMLDNLVNFSALGTSAPKYIALIVGAIVIALLPISFKRFPTAPWRVAGLLMVAVFFFGASHTGRKTAIMGTGDLVNEYQVAAETSRKIAANEKHKQDIVDSFEKNSIKDGVQYKLKKPNVIVIFAEGTSQTVIDQTASKYPGLMPNLQAFEQQSQSVTNYFNHTAPTYKGLRGQLFSSHQYYEGYEGATTAKQIKARTDTPLIGLPQILRKNGYWTGFVNPEPEQNTFTPYLKTLGFNSVFSGDERNWKNYGGQRVLSDQVNLNLLFQKATELNTKNKSFFLGSYTVQTHNSWNVTDNPYGDGSNAVLNKFHNLDTAFGEFLNQFMKSPLKDNTILIFTTDHASFPSPDYSKTMNDYRNYFVSPVPLMIRYPGAKAKTIDAKGRNSLDLAPTILDLMNIQRTKNYFLGTSLYTAKPTEYDRMTEVGPDFYSTVTGKVDWIPRKGTKLTDEILKFDTISLNM